MNNSCYRQQDINCLIKSNQIVKRLTKIKRSLPEISGGACEQKETAFDLVATEEGIKNSITSSTATCKLKVNSCTYC